VLSKRSSALFLAGPTAVGKSAVAIALAERLGGEIISVDSMQVYRGLDIGTAKPSRADRDRIPHYLIDVVDLAESFDAAQFVRLAGEAAAQIQARGKVPVFCGGTGLYFQAFLEGLGQGPPASPAMRATLEAAPLTELLDELARSDPATFERIDRANRRRVVRALEVIRLTGRPFATQRAAWQGRSPPPRGPGPESEAVADPRRGGAAPGSFQVLARAPDDLKARIDARVDGMFARGLVAETERLLARGLGQNPTAMQAIGYRQVVEHLRGERALEATIALVKQRTRQFAKRQITWFRRQTEVRWLECGVDEPPDAVAGRLLAHSPALAAH
jgi:tRNA dimethylallyltransferase